MNAENLMITAIGCVFCLVGLGIFWAVVKAISGAVDGVINRPKSSPTPYVSSTSEGSGSSYRSSTSDDYGSGYDDDDKESSGGLGSFILENIRPPDDLIDGSFLFPSSNKDDDDDDDD